MSVFECPQIGADALTSGSRNQNAVVWVQHVLCVWAL